LEENKMGMAQNILKKARSKLGELKEERQKDVVSRKLAQKQSKAEYRKVFVKESVLKAKDEARKDVRAGGKFKRKLQEAKKEVGKYHFKSTKDKGQSQGDYAREHVTLGTGKSPFN